MHESEKWKWSRSVVGHKIREYVSSQAHWMFPCMWSTVIRHHFLHPLSYHTLEFRDRKWAWVAYTLHLSLPPESALPKREHMCAFLLPAQSAAHAVERGPNSRSRAREFSVHKYRSAFSRISFFSNKRGNGSHIWFLFVFFWFPNNMSLISELMSEHRLTWL